MKLELLLDVAKKILSEIYLQCLCQDDVHPASAEN